MKKTRITKKVREDLKKLIDNHGYWSEEVKEYIEQFDYFSAGYKLNTKALTYWKYREGL